MKIEARTKLNDLIKKYPFLLDFLVRLSPKFSKLKNPIMRRTIGKLATLSQVSGLGDMPLEKLLKAIAGEIKRVAHEDVELELGEEREESVIQDKEARLEILKDIIRELHQGGNIEELKKRFASLIEDVNATEITEMEQKLIAEGMPEEEVKRLCDVHVQVFRESLDTRPSFSSIPGHPLHTLQAENRALEEIIGRLEELFQKTSGARMKEAFREVKDRLKLELEELSEVEKHYLKKENQLFPLLEAKGVSGPGKVMWAIHDDIRGHLKDLKKYIEEEHQDKVLSLGKQLVTEMRDMIYKEEKILFPMSAETLDERDWARVKYGEEEIGYAWITPGKEWQPSVRFEKEEFRLPDYTKPVSKLDLETGAMTPEQVNLVLTHLPVDLSFVDENDTVVYYSATRDRIFPRSPAVIGRKVQNCHPPASVHIVNKILDAFKAGEKDVAEFWIQMSGKFIHIRYFAVRDKQGKYRGCLEVSQDVTSIRELKGQKRLLDWD